MPLCEINIKILAFNFDSVSINDKLCISYSMYAGVTWYKIFFFNLKCFFCILLCIFTMNPIRKQKISDMS